MNRSQRRAAAKVRRPAPLEAQEAKLEHQEVKPGFLLRLFAKLVLAPWILKRVHHAAVERLLAEVAVQAGRPEVAMNLLNRIAVREANSR